MSIFKCKMCGGTIEFEGNATVGTCDSCGTQQTLPKLSDDRRANLYDRANHFRRNNEFDKAMGIYEKILNEDNTDAEAYWSLVLCRYGIEYVEDPASHKRVPTVNRAQFTSIFDDDNYGDVLEYFTYKHKEDPERGLYEPIRDDDGLLQERSSYAIACLDPYGKDAPAENWWLACTKTNLAFGKNQDHDDRKQHQYILSHPAEDRPHMTMEDLLEEGKAFARENLQGYDVLIAVHRDTDHDHIHLAINSVRAADRQPQPWMMKNEDGNIGNPAPGDLSFKARTFIAGHSLSQVFHH